MFKLKDLVTLLRMGRSESDCGHSFFRLGGRVGLTGAIIVAWTALKPQLHCALPEVTVVILKSEFKRFVTLQNIQVNY